MVSVLLIVIFVQRVLHLVIQFKIEQNQHTKIENFNGASMKMLYKYEIFYYSIEKHSSTLDTKSRFCKFPFLRRR